MLTSSAKNKGRRACLQVKDLLEKYAPDLRPGDIEVTSSGATGEDIKLSPAARLVYPFGIEVKNQENINIWKAFEQAISHVEGCEYEFRVPVVFYKRNKSELMVTLRAEDFIKLIR